MEITYLGQTGYRIKSKSGIVVINPVGKKMSADIVVLSERKGNSEVGVDGTARRKTAFVVNEPGEYEVESISVFGYASSLENTFFVIHADDLRVAYLGQLKTELNKAQLKKLEGVDVLIVPPKMGEVEDKKMVELVNAIEPSYILPMCKQIEGKEVVELLGKTVEVVGSLNINKATLPVDLSEIVFFE